MHLNGQVPADAIAEAIQQAVAGDTVRLPAGTLELKEPIRLKSGIRLIGAGQEKTLVTCAGTKPTSLIGLRACEDVEIDTGVGKDASVGLTRRDRSGS